MAGYYLSLDTAADIADTPEYDEEEQKDKPSLTNLRESLQSYANFKKTI